VLASDYVCKEVCLLTIPRFDIFRIDKDGSFFWIGTADNVKEAQELATQNPSPSKHFVLFDLKTGAKMAMSGDYEAEIARAVLAARSLR
jgi:hypothetical protein